jgi:outer membrane immunogenic protein
MRSRAIALAIALSSVAFSSAKSADLPAPYSPPPAQAPVAYNPTRLGPWTGFYFGGNIGDGWTNTDGGYTLSGNAFTTGTVLGNPFNLNGVNGGLQAGYNWQTGILLVGLEGDIQAADQDRTINYSCGPTCSIAQTAKIDWFSTFRARAGIAIKDVLFYGTGGLSWIHGENDFNGTLNGGPASLGNFTYDSLGWVAGGGIEWMFWYGWSAKIEYLYLQTNNSSSTITVPAASGGGTLTSTPYRSDNIFRVGFNYHFGFPYGAGWPSR